MYECLLDVRKCVLGVDGIIKFFMYVDFLLEEEK